MTRKEFFRSLAGAGVVVKAVEAKPAPNERPMLVCFEFPGKLDCAAIYNLHEQLGPIAEECNFKSIILDGGATAKVLTAAETNLE